MNYSLVALLLALVEVGAAATGYALGSVPVFSNVIIYGSPLYLVMNLFTSGSAFIDSNPLYMGFIAFHLIKYFCFIRAQLADDGNNMRLVAIALEAAYLATSAYYIY